MPPPISLLMGRRLKVIQQPFWVSGKPESSTPDCNARTEGPRQDTGLRTSVSRPAVTFRVASTRCPESSAATRVNGRFLALLHSVGPPTISGVQRQAATEPIYAFMYSRPLDELQ